MEKTHDPVSWNDALINAIQLLNETKTLSRLFDGITVDSLKKVIAVIESLKSSRTVPEITTYSLGGLQWILFDNKNLIGEDFYEHKNEFSGEHRLYRRDNNIFIIKAKNKVGVWDIKFNGYLENLIDFIAILRLLKI